MATVVTARNDGGVPASESPRGVAVPIVLGVLSTLFFSSSFIANRLMAVEGGPWEWSAVLRFLFSLPVFAVIVAARGGLRPVLDALRAEPARWMLWSTVGFGLFYAPLCLAAELAPGWTVAAAWQITIVCGMLLAPFLYRKGDPRRRIPRAGLALSPLILGGVLLTQAGAHADLGWQTAAGLGVVLVAACAYPVGNRRTMELAGDRLDTFQRLLAMSIASLPFLLLLGASGGLRAGAPTPGQLTATAIVAVSSGVIATSLFFAATRRVRDHPVRLAAVEATQAAEVVCVALLEPLFTGADVPGPLAWAGIAAITAGIAAQAFGSRR